MFIKYFLKKYDKRDYMKNAVIRFFNVLIR